CFDRGTSFSKDYVVGTEKVSRTLGGIARRKTARIQLYSTTAACFPERRHGNSVEVVPKSQGPFRQIGQRLTRREKALVEEVQDQFDLLRRDATFDNESFAGNIIDRDVSDDVRMPERPFFPG